MQKSERGLQVLSGPDTLKTEDIIRANSSLQKASQETEPIRSRKSKTRTGNHPPKMENPAPSIYEVARRLGYPQETLYQYFPEYCRAIGQRYRKYRAEQRKRRIDGIGSEVREAAHHLYAQGHYPTEWEIRRTITTRGAFKIPEV